jgi:cytochrome c biogenesis protein CcdA
MELSSPGAALLMGLAGSVGPCGAPRYLALAAASGRYRGRARTMLVMSFIGGLTCAYALLAFGISMIAQASEASRFAYAALAVGSTVAGLWALAGPSHGAACERSGPRTTAGASFVAGALLGSVISPCCTPALAAIGFMAGKVGFAHALLVFGAFALGHFAPLVIASTGARRVSQLVRGAGLEEAGRIVNGGLLLACGLYYGVLS